MKYLIALLVLVSGCHGIDNPHMSEGAVVDKINPTLVMVFTPDRGFGTGSYVKTPSGKSIIITNAHVCEDFQKVGVREYSSGTLSLSTVIKLDKTLDLCAIAIPEQFKHLKTFIPASDAKVGEWIFTIGFGMAHYIYTHGRIMHDDIMIWGHIVSRADAFAIGGQSGSPVVNMNGEFIGVLEGESTDQEGMADALFIPVSEVKEFLKDL